MMSKREKMFALAGAGAAVLLFALVISVKNSDRRGFISEFSGPFLEPAVSARAARPAHDKAAGRMEAPRMMAASQGSVPTTDEVPDASHPRADERKLIKTGNLSIEVKDYDKAVKAIDALLGEFEGFILRSSKHISDDNYASGDISVKVKPSHFDSFVSKLDGLGRVKSKNSYINDVTEQYIDLESRLNSNLRVEKRLREILSIKTKNVKDILEVEKELARVGEKIEQFKGRIKYLDNQIGLATINIRIDEKKSIVTGSYKFLERIKQAFRGAVNAFISITSGLITLIGALIALSIYGLLFALLIVGIKKFRKK